MRIGTRIALAVFALALAMPARAAKPDKPDCSAALPAVQSAVAMECDCLGSSTHGQYVRCAVKVVKRMTTEGALARGCRGQMVRTFAKSTCGKPESVACCLPRDGATVCVVKRSSVCTRIGGMVGGSPLCVDACSTGSPSGAFVD